MAMTTSEILCSWCGPLDTVIIKTSSKIKGALEIIHSNNFLFINEEVNPNI